MAKECDQLNNALSAGFIPRAYRRMCVKMLSASLSINKNPFVCTKMCGKQQEAAAAVGAGSREQEQGVRAGTGVEGTSCSDWQAKFAHTRDTEAAQRLSLRGVKCQANSLRPEWERKRGRKGPRDREGDKEWEIAREAAVHSGEQHQKNILTKHNLCCANFVEEERRGEQREGKRGKKNEGGRGEEGKKGKNKWQSAGRWAKKEAAKCSLFCCWPARGHCPCRARARARSRPGPEPQPDPGQTNMLQALWRFMTPCALRASCSGFNAPKSEAEVRRGEALSPRAGKRSLCLARRESQRLHARHTMPSLSCPSRPHGDCCCCCCQSKSQLADRQSAEQVRPCAWLWLWLSLCPVVLRRRSI